MPQLLARQARQRQRQRPVLGVANIMASALEAALLSQFA